MKGLVFGSTWHNRRFSHDGMGSNSQRTQIVIKGFRLTRAVLLALFFASVAACAAPATPRDQRRRCNANNARTDGRGEVISPAVKSLKRCVHCVFARGEIIVDDADQRAHRGEMTSPLRRDDTDAVDSLPINVMLNGAALLR